MQFLPVFITFTTTILLLLILRPLAFKFELLDSPGGRKKHAHHTPVVGGIAILVGLFVGLIVSPGLLSLYHGFLAAVLLLTAFSLLDDVRPLSAKLRFVVQLLAGLIMTLWSGVQLHRLGQIFFAHDLGLNVFSIPVTIFGVVIVINAINFMDGLDGLAGSIVFIILGFLAFLAQHAGVPEFKMLCLLMAGVFAFLLFNLRIFGRPAALVFMGDSGSMFLGFAIVWFSTTLSQNSAPVVAAPITFLWLVAIPIYDVLLVTIRRVRSGLSPLGADRSHLHHVLQAVGLSANQVVLLISSLVFFMGIIGIFGPRYLPEYVMFYSFVALFIVYVVILNNLWKKVSHEHHS